MSRQYLLVGGPANGHVVETDAMDWRVPVRLSRPLGVDPDPEPWKTSPFPRASHEAYQYVTYQVADTLYYKDPDSPPWDRDNVWLMHTMTVNGEKADFKKAAGALIKAFGTKLEYM